jgi:hypothetical protein
MVALTFSDFHQLGQIVLLRATVQLQVMFDFFYIYQNKTQS